MSYKQVYYHVVWTTKNRAPAITPDLESNLYQIIAKKVFGLGGHLYAINCVSDHIHIVVSIPVTIPVSKFIGQIKGVASTKINKTTFEIGQFQWQSGYSVFSIGQKDLNFYIQYVKKQKEHHLKQKAPFRGRR